MCLFSTQVVLMRLTRFVQDFTTKDRRVKFVGSEAVYFNKFLVRGLLARDGLRDGD